ncbi:hypothetical protein GCM10027445_11900 [Amycolatopsis endophytica]|uniref:Uncharacterized protein n=1 Tax=Amycolatopsis endophytica TaxID=860233 RepID=A0A853B3E3_9PSEU|nr:hypothetical protein [Amycolatopsis endophytica]NYI89327.1 hypothetical protein [Amycolatopsis endophytica]
MTTGAHSKGAGSGTTTVADLLARSDRPVRQRHSRAGVPEPSPVEMTMPNMVAAISVLDSKSPRRLERPPVAGAAGMRVFGTGSFGSAGTVGATSRGSDEGDRTGRTTAPGRMSGEATPAALATTPVASPPAAPAAPVEASTSETIVFDAVVPDAAVIDGPSGDSPAEPLIVSVEADTPPAKERRHRPLVLATAGAGLTLAGAMLVGGWISGPGTPEPVSLAGGHAAPQEPTVSDPGEQAEILATEGRFSGILPVAETKQVAAPQQTEAPKTSSPTTTKKTTRQAAPKQTRQQRQMPRVQMPRFDIPQYTVPHFDPPRYGDWDDRNRHDRDWGHDWDHDRDGRHHR